MVGPCLVRQGSPRLARFDSPKKGSARILDGPQALEQPSPRTAHAARLGANSLNSKQTSVISGVIKNQ